MCVCISFFACVCVCVCEYVCLWVFCCSTRTRRVVHKHWKNSIKIEKKKGRLQFRRMNERCHRKIKQRKKKKGKLFVGRQ